MIIAIDPGPVESGVAMLTYHGDVATAGIHKNALVRSVLADTRGGHLVIEQIVCYGMPVGAEVIETAEWIGQFICAWDSVEGRQHVAYKLPRKDVKLHICGSGRAKDANIRQALLDRYGPKGTKKAPGPLYGFKSHMWQALALGLTYLETRMPHPARQIHGSDSEAGGAAAL